MQRVRVQGSAADRPPLRHEGDAVLAPGGTAAEGGV